MLPRGTTGFLLADGTVVLVPPGGLTGIPGWGQIAAPSSKEPSEYRKIPAAGCIDGTGIKQSPL